MKIPTLRHPRVLCKGAARNADSTFMSTPHADEKTNRRRSKPGLSSNCKPPSKLHHMCTKLECTCPCHTRNTRLTIQEQKEAKERR